jgi:argininosuccinate lyase
LLALLTTLKALPLAYNKDLQEDKEGFFDTVDTLTATLDIFARMLPTIRIHPERMAAAAIAGYALATDVADYLARKDVPFRQAHHIAGRLVADAIAQGKELHELSLADYQRHSPLFEADVLDIDLAHSVNARTVPGGTAPARVREALAAARVRLESEFALTPDPSPNAGRGEPPLDDAAPSPPSLQGKGAGGLGLPRLGGEGQPETHP